MRNKKRFLAVQLIGVVILSLTMTGLTRAQGTGDNESTKCGDACCILGKWAVGEKGRYIVAIYKENRVSRLCVDPGGSRVSLTVDGGGLELVPGGCKDFEGKDFRIESRGSASSGTYDVVR